MIQLGLDVRKKRASNVINYELRDLEGNIGEVPRMVTLDGSKLKVILILGKRTLDDVGQGGWLGTHLSVQKLIFSPLWTIN